MNPRLPTRTALQGALTAARFGAVFPLAGKAPWIGGGRGVLDATTDRDQIINWWTVECPGANVGLRVPKHLAVIDVDPRHDGHLRLAEHEAAHGTLPATFTVYSGRGDGGRHLYFQHPGGKLTASRLGDGLDLKTHSGYVVVPPSLHPDTGKPYRAERHPIASPPRWLVDLITVPVVTTSGSTGGTGRATVPTLGADLTPAEAFEASTTWREFLTAYGWTLVRGNGDDDGSTWRHPHATEQKSATVKRGYLFTYSTNTPFPVTTADDPHGISRFRAWAILEHRGDLKAAARHLRLNVMGKAS